MPVHIYSATKILSWYHRTLFKSNILHGNVAICRLAGTLPGGTLKTTNGIQNGIDAETFDNAGFISHMT